MDKKSELKFAPSCPYCRGVGAPNECMMHDQQRTITFVCSTCHKTWTATDRVPYESASRAQPST
mgnify:CR=1 FL=1